MKQQIILTVCGFMMATTALTQVTVKNPSPNHNVEFRRCIQTDDNAFIDLMITNTSNQDTKIRLGGIEIYDDEGNTYKDTDRSGSGWSTGPAKVFIATSTTDNSPLRSSDILIPEGTFYRVRIMISGGFDKYAAEIKLLKLDFVWDLNTNARIRIRPSGPDQIEVRNFPIIRE